jgi:hypothetical protein
MDTSGNCKCNIWYLQAEYPDRTWLNSFRIQNGGIKIIFCVNLFGFLHDYELL